MNNDIGSRFKGYEGCWDLTLPRRMPLIIRVDGRAFHSLPLRKPFDDGFMATMDSVALALCEEVQGAVLAYTQSDEISVVARDDITHATEPWLGKRLSRITSIAAAIATARFNKLGDEGAEAQFDARAFVVPDATEAFNYLVWRQQDATRNSISMYARGFFSHKQCHGKGKVQLLDMLRNNGTPWEELEPRWKRGSVAFRERDPTGNGWVIDENPPIFTADHDYLERIYRSPEPQEAAP